MLRQSIFLLVILCAATRINAQQSNTTFVPAHPEGGARIIGLTYHSIRFTNAQRNGFATGDVKLVFQIDTLGHAYLDDVEGLTDPSIIDSLKNRDAPEFVPAMLNGKKQRSQQTFHLSFPFSQALYSTICYGMFDMSEVSQLETWRRMEFSLGGIMNFHTGNSGNYLYPGGGYRMEGVYKPREKTGVGFAMGMYGNQFRKSYPVAASMRLRNTALSVFMGALVTHPVYQKGKHEVHLQAELSYISQSVSRTSEDEESGIYLNGYAPGIMVRYAIQIGKERLHYQVGSPIMQSHRIEFHAAVRRAIYNLDEASSTIVETGISYRLVARGVKYFKMK